MIKKQNLILIIAILVIVFGATTYLIFSPEKGEISGPGEKPEEAEEAMPGEGPGEPEEVPAGEGEATPGGPEAIVEDWQKPEEPMESAPLEETEIPKEAIKIVITAEGFNPSTFEVKRNEKIILSVTSGDEWTHVFKFEAEQLSDVAVGVGPGETRAITFYAPAEPGEYPFFCDVPGHRGRGEEGKMIVK